MMMKMEMRRKMPARHFSHLPMPLLTVQNLRTYFPVYGGVLRRHISDVKAVDDVSFTIEEGTTVACVWRRPEAVATASAAAM